MSSQDTDIVNNRFENRSKKQRYNSSDDFNNYLCDYAEHLDEQGKNSRRGLIIVIIVIMSVLLLPRLYHFAVFRGEITPRNYKITGYNGENYKERRSAEKYVTIEYRVDNKKYTANIDLTNKEDLYNDVVFDYKSNRYTKQEPEDILGDLYYNVINHNQVDLYR